MLSMENVQEKEKRPPDMHTAKKQGKEELRAQCMFPSRSHPVDFIPVSFSFPKPIAQGSSFRKLQKRQKIQKQSQRLQTESTRKHKIHTLETLFVSSRQECPSFHHLFIRMQGCRPFVLLIQPHSRGYHLFDVHNQYSAQSIRWIRRGSGPSCVEFRISR